MSSPVSTPDAETTLGKFHLFGELPTELRLSILETAARSAMPGIQFFGANWTGEAESEGPIDLELVEPRVQDISGPLRSRVDGNPSTYNQDFGLWMASYESRDFMLRHYQHLENAITEEEDPNTLFGDQSHFVVLGGDRFSKVFPKQDLLCFQPFQTSLDYGDLPFFREDSPYKVKNLALEYDPAWMNGLVQARTDGARAQARADIWREDSPRGVFIRSLWAMAERTGPANMTLWLIDSSLRRLEMPSNVFLPDSDSDSDSNKNSARNDDTAKDRPKKAEPEPRVFQSMGARCVEAKDLSECVYAALKPNTAFHFLHELQISVGFNIDWMISVRRNQDAIPLPNGLEDLVKVLCVEPN